ncbi:MAG: hypothetical protein FP825_09360 [Hyphomonas sp.]|uniref:hypothetical protein n=1 Tax=Hyphomonas sp. TaxID=87 RepID=UPI0017E99250|nr:hypothetical protein [Hyphomonas sp.]MBU3922089.1 hypothetical protein [Alphaproteobacteria bacterium]MBA3068676.1 hypothetical protein [Hyphomonas sp.]MBU4063661.1 hypothetical protein [Alphaproteobacteria bacterium]MBU4165714.1 hypothetical protein [Alphaproteobacteria bacterium]MBU4567339.1 hypothetical protein [Alphaproteobacteria bacterium]
MRNILGSLALALTAACTVAAAPDLEPESELQPDRLGAEVQTLPGFDQWGTGEGAYAFHRLTATCDTLIHAHGRNAASGLWRMPIGEVVVGEPELAADGSALVRLTCRDGSACIRQGALDATPDRVREHAVPFGTPDLARAYSDRVAKLRDACRQYL